MACAVTTPALKPDHHQRARASYTLGPINHKSHIPGISRAWPGVAIIVRLLQLSHEPSVACHKYQRLLYTTSSVVFRKFIVFQSHQTRENHDNL
ncbi:hypothetical protein HCU01_32890 [Halomonas cupida]|uniref:Uncharacterized protein n=1 Tax=Halomonas cupida TaxID=44933 RepID=A0A1M7LQR1_9GAMM|nr:hypothetical protein HCU01_32890 [Halomonas cupida]SHM80530.1 hypothetical protein SAMN05660971_03922 [Halomonas cupida]